MPTPSRRTVLAGTAVATGLSALGVEAMAVDPVRPDRLCLAADGRGIQYGEPA
ncbi:twin-arginine translocation signal domain-containing protein [Streptomyces sp. NPDC017958]|uniref:twin-arginine translocation signal domain-containing protein n=1 Tax=Streptomyces sp. NPDC017958 TaxID=3365021 RepID=UPI0037B17D4C